MPKIFSHIRTALYLSASSNANKYKAIDIIIETKITTN